ncbi:hypothetical protein [Natronococcus occultus]|uniref:Uncharacterized protein n=1 Tax=Natronococcus occultus SP4 TaxID=694430 RepID=L0JZW5_9EURY|nr:hypothetical protein [Natronococcus occultus]AGB37825.1 hypothetical protein Natoc_2039 [Natronococcus occultus SP4]
MDRQLAAGLAATATGVAAVLVLGAAGVLRHPQAAADHTQPAEFLAIGGSLLLVTVGVLVTLFAYVEFPEPDVDP